MAMKIREFVERLNTIKASVKAGEVSPVIQADLDRVTAHLRSFYDAAAFKAAVAEDADVSSVLEEDITTLQMEWMRHRGAH